MKSYIISAMLCIATISFSYAQTLPSPASQGIIGSQNSNGGLFTGSTTIGVPLFAATANNGATIPVSLSYGTSGIKVGQVATPVGLGWNLNAGGTITRVIRGIPDEYASMVNDPTALNHTKLNNILTGKKDGEKDLFYLSFPGGGGRFIFEGDFNEYLLQDVWCNDAYTDLQDCQQNCSGEACQSNCHDYTMSRLACDNTFSWSNFQTLPYSDISITYYFDGFTDGYWEVTDMRGVKYTFATTETTTSNSTEPGVLTYDPANAYDYVSSWHLTSITYPDLPASHGITFTYSDSVNLVQETLNKKSYATAPISGGSLTFEHTEIVRSKTETGVRYLEGIHFTKGDIAFGYTDERDDLPGAKRLASVTLSDKLGNDVSTYSFVQNYFSSRYSYLQGGTNPTVNRPECSRLKLESIYKDGGFVQSFTYRNELDYVPGSGINYYELPPRDSYYTDHWGYNNAGDHQGTTFVPYPAINDASTEERPSASFTIAGMDKDATAHAQANILSRINFPTGGYTQYTYGNHASGGGVRLERVETFNEQDVRVAGNSFAYSEPAAFSNPVYHRTEDLDYEIGSIPSGRDRLAIYEQSLSSVFDLNGTSIGYGKVTVSDLMRGNKSDHYFNNDLRLDLVKPDKHTYTIADDGSFIDRGAITDSNLAPFSTNSLLFYDRGSYDRMEVFGEEDAINPILVRTYNYESINSTPYYTIPSLATEVKKDFGSSQDVMVSQYDVVVKTFRLLSTTETTYENDGEVSTTRLMTYHSNFPTLTAQVDANNSRGYNSKSFYSYPIDIGSSTKHHIGALNTMMSKGMNGIMVQSESQVNFEGTAYETTQVSLTRFKSEHSLIVPHQQFTLLETPTNSWTEADLAMVNEYLDYDPNGLLLSRKGYDEVTVNMEYDAYGFLEKTIVNPGTSYERETIYDNKMLVGLNQITDANGRKVSNEYDDRNRLLLTRDNDDNITARYRYHSVSDNNELNAETVVDWHVDGNYEDRNHQFSLENINCPYGECTYSWNWGDGSGNSTGTQANHTYASGGAYQIKVTISNPEYNEAVIITKNISIQALEYWALSMNGPSEHCIYDSNAPQDFGTIIGNGVSTCSPGGQYTYAWSYQYNSSGSFVPFGTGQPSESWPQNTNVTGNHKVRVTVTDQCNRSLSVTKDFDIIDSGNDCSSGGGTGNPPE